MASSCSGTELSAEWLFDAEMLARPGFDMARITEFGTLVMERDAAVCELNQRGLGSGPFDRGVLMQEEYEVFLLQDRVRGMLGEPTLGEPTLGEAAGSRASRRAEQTGGADGRSRRGEVRPGTGWARVPTRLSH